MKKWILAFSMSFIATCSLAAAVESPELIVKNVSRDVLDIIKKNDKEPLKARDLVDARVAPLADYNRMTMLAVGRYWKTATPEQQQALTREFRTMLVRTYLSALSIYKNAQVDVKGTRPGNDASEMTVRTEVSLPGQKPIPLDFSFEKTDAGWKTYDIAVDGISFINNNRNQFNAIIRKDGVDGLIKQLSDRNNVQRSASK
jgi:phospholipid transport system substrate-binding protein